MSAFGGNGMPHCVFATAVDRTRRVIHLPVPDGELVTRFTTAGDPDAFAQLFRRHGPMVLAVCRRVTRHRQDAEDAFQAAFLILTRKAGTVNPPGAIAGWLFGVAVNAAREARKRSARRAVRESLVATIPETGWCEPEPDFDRRAVVAEELAGLPEGYRALIVACDLQGEPQSAAARRLGVPVGTVYSRLSTARRLLADRLRRRGISTAAAVAALAALAPEAVALPSVSDCPSPGVMELTEAIMKSGLALRWKLAACVLLAGVATGLADEVPKPAPAPAIAPAPRAADESRLVLGLAGHVRFLKSDGTEVSRLTGDAAVKAGADIPTQSRSLDNFLNATATASATETFGPCGRAAPDGRLPLDTRKGLYLLTPGNPPVVAPVKAAKGNEALFASGDVPHIVAWAPDGKRAVGRWTRRPLFSGPSYEHVLIDLTAGTTTELKLPKNRQVVDWSADGWFLAIDEDREGYLKGWAVKSQTLCKVSADGKTSDALAAYSFDFDWSRPGEFLNSGASSNVVALSPDGKRVACLVSTTVPIQVGEESVPKIGIKLCVLDLANKARAAVAFEVPGKRVDGTILFDVPHGVRWSPDGARIGFLCHHWESGTQSVSSWRVGVVAADGRGAKTVFASDKTDPKSPPPSLTLFDWR
ncbi:MAG: sigma-70 family polymerase sigma factor [Gemmataceae bacterium]|nr:sigma-70 family polymerase sigma factor [Gemmataceae bacterium]